MYAILRETQEEAEDATDFVLQSERSDSPGTRVNNDVVERRCHLELHGNVCALLLLLHGSNRVLLKLIEVPGDLTVQVLWHHANGAEERPEHIELFVEQLDPFLQQIVIFHQQLDLLLGFTRSHLCLFATFPHGDVISLPSSPVLVARLVDGLGLLPGDVRGGVMLMGHYRPLHGSTARRLMNRCTWMTARYRGRRQGGKGLTTIGEWVIRHRAVTGRRILRTVASVVRRIQRLFLDAGRLRSRAVAVAAAVAVLMVGRTAVYRLRHIGERRTRITTCPDMLYGIVIGTKHIQ